MSMGGWAARKGRSISVHPFVFFSADSRHCKRCEWWRTWKTCWPLSCCARVKVLRTSASFVGFSLSTPPSPALDFLRPLRSTKPIEAVYELIRTRVPSLDHDRFMSPDIAAVMELIRSGQVWRVVEHALLSPSDLDD